MKHFCRAVLAVIIILNAYGLELEIKKNIGPLIIVKIGELQFLLDSGSNANFINSSSLDKFKSFIARDVANDKFVNTFSGKTKTEAYKMSLDLGEIKLVDMESYVMNTLKFTEADDGIECCDGILGMPFLKKNKVEVDIGAKKVIIHKNLKTVKNISKLSKLKFNLLGKDTIVIDCALGNHKQRLRLDTGSEVPFIFHRHAVEKMYLREQLFDQSFSGLNLPFFKLSNFTCSKSKFDSIVATYFYGMTGALVHEGVEANVGGYILGERYILDIANSNIYYSPKALEFSYGKKIYSIENNFKMNISHPSLLAQAKALMVNSCSQSSSFEDCMRLVCSIEGKKICSVKNTGSVLDDFVNFYFDLKTPDCSVESVVDELRERPVRYNFCWYKLFELNFKNHKIPLVQIKLPLKFRKFEEKLNIISVSDVKDLTSNFYCLSVFNNIVTMKNLGPSLFSLSIKGATFGRDKINSYYSWLESEEGKSCQANVKEQLGFVVNKNLDDLFTKDYLIVVAPWTILGDGADHYERNYARVLSHEMNHIRYALDSENKEWSMKQWGKISQKDKNEFIKMHPSYNFRDENILFKEYFSYSNENDRDFATR